MESRPAFSAAPTRLSVDHDLCIGSGECIRLHPEAFRLDERAGVTDALPGADLLSPPARERVIDSCPMGAISVRAAEPGS